MTTCIAGSAFGDTNFFLVDALRDMVFDGRYEQVDARVRDAVIRLQTFADSGLTYPQRARMAYDQLRQVLTDLGPADTVAADLPTLFALFDWSAIAAPDLFPVLSGHFTLTVGAIQRLGSGSARQQEQLALLNDAGHVGVFLLTELGYGSNVLEMETEAVWDQQAGCFMLTTPNGAACKFMPNVAAEGVPKLTIVAARLKVDGKDEGIFPFIVPLRTGMGTAAGVEVIALPDKGFAPMDNAMIRFDHVALPYDAWLSGGTAHIDGDGSFVCAIPARERFHRTIEQLQAGRIALSAGAVASARSALWLTTRYALQRRTAGGIAMLQRDNVQRDLASCAARVYAATALANVVRRRFADPTSDPAQNALLAMLTKPLLSATALAVLQECRERCGAQGMFRVNRIPDYIGNAQGVVTAEGENQVLRIAAGRALRRMLNGRGVVPTAGDGSGEPDWWHDLLTVREQALATTVVPKEGSLGATSAIGPSCCAIDLAGATADRLAAEALAEAARNAAPPARELLRALLDVYVLEAIQRHAGWYTANGRMSAERAAAVERRLAMGYRTVAAQLSPLVEAFEVPDLAAPIAGDYITAWLEATGWEHTGHPNGMAPVANGVGAVPNGAGAMSAGTWPAQGALVPEPRQSVLSPVPPEPGETAETRAW